MRIRFFVLLTGLFLCWQSSNVQAAPLDGNAGIRLGDVIRLKHNSTGKYLTAGIERYTHPNAAYIVYGAERQGDDTLWIVKGPHHDDDRWNCQLGDLVVCDTVLRFENVATHRNLHHDGSRSSISGQNEVSSYGRDMPDGIGNAMDNWQIREVTDGSRGVLCNGRSVKMAHSITGGYLHSHPRLLNPTNQWYEITTYWTRDDNDWFTVEVVTTVAQSTDVAIKEKFEKDRTSKLMYNTLVFIDPGITGWDSYGTNRRLWTHAGSAFVDINYMNSLSSRMGGIVDKNVANKITSLKHSYEILAGPWSEQRVQGSASWFLLKNVDDESNTGPVKYGDRIKIFSVFAAPGDPTIAGVLDPIKPWTMHAHQAFPTFDTIMVRDLTDQDVASKNGIFRLEPTLVGLKFGDEIAEIDLVQIRSMQETNRVLWLYNCGSRYGGGYLDLLSGNRDDDYGLNTGGYSNYRDQLYHRFCIHPIKKEDVPAWADAFLKKAVAKNEVPLPVAAPVAAKAEESKSASEASSVATTIVAAKDDGNKKDSTPSEAASEFLVAADKKEDTSSSTVIDAKKTDNASTDSSDSIPANTATSASADGKRDEASAAAASDATAAVATDSSNNSGPADGATPSTSDSTAAATPDSTTSVAADSSSAGATEKVPAVTEKSQGDEPVSQASTPTPIIQKLDEKAVEDQCKLDQLALLQKQLEHVVALPIGFQVTPGKLQSIGAGNGEIFGVTDANLPVQMVLAPNPWMLIDVKDDAGKDLTGFKSISVGADGATYAVMQDGSVYRRRFAKVVGISTKKKKSKKLKHATK